MQSHLHTQHDLLGRAPSEGDDGWHVVALRDTTLMSRSNDSSLVLALVQEHQGLHLYGCTASSVWCEVSCYDEDGHVIKGFLEADDIVVWYHGRAYGFWAARSWLYCPVVEDTYTPRISESQKQRVIMSMPVVEYAPVTPHHRTRHLSRFIHHPRAHLHSM